MYGNAKKQYDNTNSAGLFMRQKQNQNSPDMGGDVTLGGEVLDYIMKCIQSGQPPKLYINGWRKNNQKGPLISLSFRPPMEAMEQRFGGGGQRQQQGGGFQQQQGNGYAQQRGQQQFNNYNTGASGGGYVGQSRTSAPDDFRDQPDPSRNPWD